MLAYHIAGKTFADYQCARCEVRSSGFDVLNTSNIGPRTLAQPARLFCEVVSSGSTCADHRSSRVQKKLSGACWGGSILIVSETRHASRARPRCWKDRFPSCLPLVRKRGL